ncbi:hypothetical protein F4861DRAFT_544401 [Xylaria intraflava]|nr:hypothetical protein F4861DRAFT_544401 [Xylaria intraflava]
MYPQLGITPSLGPYWDDFVTSFTGRLSQYPEAYKQEVLRAGGLFQDTARHPEHWHSLGVQPPKLIPAGPCWAIKPKDEQYMSDLLTNFAKEKNHVYQTGNSRDTLEFSPVQLAYKQLFLPDLENPIYAVNLATNPEEVQLQLPPELDVLPRHEEHPPLTTNITPRYTVVDAHIDHGAHVLTLLTSGCVKLWALYPLTEQNRQALGPVYGSKNMFLDLVGKLEGGDFCIQTEGEAIYLPPGCIHSTVTIRGGLTLGLLFETPVSVYLAGVVFDLDQKFIRRGDLECHSLLTSIDLARQRGTAAEKREASARLCAQFKLLKARAPAKMAELLNQKALASCPRCGKSWASHRAVKELSDLGN